MTGLRVSSVLFAGLVDDAGLFPPTALPMNASAARHRADLAAGEPVLTHRFLCPASRIGELRAHLEDGDRFKLGLIADTGADGLHPAIDAIDADPRLELAAVEFPLARTGLEDPADALNAACEAAAAAGEVPLFVEPTELSDVDSLAAAVAAKRSLGRLGVKLRCGGIRQELFPSPEDLASAIVSVVAHGVLLKATAGLHHAIRHTDPTTGLVHHGYLNLLVAVAEAVAGAEAEAVAETLLVTDAADLVERVGQLDEEQAAAVRRTFVSYGSCSTRVPVDEARELGLV